MGQNASAEMRCLWFWLWAQPDVRCGPLSQGTPCLAGLPQGVRRHRRGALRVLRERPRSRNVCTFATRPACRVLPRRPCKAGRRAGDSDAGREGLNASGFRTKDFPAGRDAAWPALRHLGWCVLLEKEIWGEGGSPRHGHRFPLARQAPLGQACLLARPHSRREIIFLSLVIAVSAKFNTKPELITSALGWLWRLPAG